MDAYPRLPDCSKRVAILFFLCIIFLTFIIRYPATDHIAEHGSDTSAYLAESQMITTSGRIPWAFNIAAYFGLVPYTDQVALPLLISGLFQMTKLSMDITIILLDTLLSFVAALTVFAVSLRLFGNRFAALMSLIAFQAIPILDYYLTISITSRLLVILFIPSIILCMIAFMNHSDRRFLILLAFFIILVSLSHLTFIFIMLAICVILFVLVIIRITKNRITRRFLLLPKMVRTLGIIVFIAAPIILSCFLAIKLESYSEGIFQGNAWYVQILNASVSIAGGGGILASILGSAAIISYPFKFEFHRRYTILFGFLLTFMIFLAIRIYIRPFLPVILAFFAGAFMIWVFPVIYRHRSRILKISITLLIIFLVISSFGFTGAMKNHWTRPDLEVSDQLYELCIYVKDAKPKSVITNSYLEDRWIQGYTAIPALPVLPGSGLEMNMFIYGPEGWSTLEIVLISPDKINENTRSLYIVNYNPYADYLNLMKGDYTNDKVKHLLRQYNITLIVENLKFEGKRATRWDREHEPVPISPFLISLHENSYIIYINNNYAIWVS